jgi:hypothetical protein
VIQEPIVINASFIDCNDACRPGISYEEINMLYTQDNVNSRMFGPNHWKNPNQANNDIFDTESISCIPWTLDFLRTIHDTHFLCYIPKNIAGKVSTLHKIMDCYADFFDRYYNAEWYTRYAFAYDQLQRDKWLLTPFYDGSFLIGSSPSDSDLRKYESMDARETIAALIMFRLNFGFYPLPANQWIWCSDCFYDRIEFHVCVSISDLGLIRLEYVPSVQQYSAGAIALFKRREQECAIHEINPFV